VNKLLLPLTGSKNVEYADFVRNFEAETGRKIFKLQTGDPDFATPQKISDAIKIAFDKKLTHYANSQGNANLRKALANKLNTENKIKASADQIIVTAGGVHGVFLAINALVNPNDKALIFEPYWMPYNSILQLAGANVVKVKIDMEAFNEEKIIESFLQTYTDDVRVVIVNSPNNPGGFMFSRAFYEKLLNRLSPQTYLLSDEVYERVIYGEMEHISAASLQIKASQIISVFSFSKTYAMTGWRVGYVHATDEVIKEMLKLLQFTLTCVAPFVQEACVTAVTDQTLNNDVEAMVAKYKARREELKRIPGVKLPPGAFYCFLPIPEQCKHHDFPVWMVKEHSVSVSPGEAFGDYPNYFRISFAVDDETWEKGITTIVKLYSEQR
jgi:aspartate/methionine/tyrosine aminotransferase